MDQYDIIAVIVGVMFTIRKLDTQSRSAAQQPSVSPEDFENWQRRAASAYAPGAYASFFRVVFHFGYVRYAARHPLEPTTFGRIALIVDLVWVISVVSTLIRSYYAGELRKKLGIVLEKPQRAR